MGGEVTAEERIKAALTYVTGRTPPRIMSDGEIARELPAAHGLRRVRLKAELDVRRRTRASILDDV